MMAGYLILSDGRRLLLPPWRGYRLKRTGTVPCDSFEGSCIWDGDPEPALGKANQLILEENGVRRFTGLLDEYELSWGEEGSVLNLSARGMAALLLDNEACGQDYLVATLEDVVGNHVIPVGVELGQLDRLPAVNGFSVATGSSQWQVLDSFMRNYRGLEAYFDEYGCLSVSRGRGRRVLGIDQRTGVTRVVWRDRRCKVCSEVLVRPRGPGETQRLINRDFFAQGGRRCRVITMPGKMGYQAMRYSGQYQLEQSAAQRFRLELTVAGDFRCQPGEQAEVQLTRPALSGSWRVLETEHILDRTGCRTILTLG